MPGGLGGLGQLFGLGESAANTVGQGIGGILSAGSQLIGQAILGTNTPRIAQQTRDTANWAYDHTRDVTQETATRMASRAQDANQWNTNGSQQAGEYANFKAGQQRSAETLDADQQAAKNALTAGTMAAERFGNELLALGHQQISDVMASTAEAKASFEGDRMATLNAFKDDVAARMESFKGANSAFISTGVQKAMEALQASGNADDDLARLQAEQQIKMGYTNQLGAQLTQFSSDASKRLVDTHLSLMAERTKLFEATESAKNAAFGTAGENINKAGTMVSTAHLAAGETLQKMAAFRADFGEQQATHGVEAYKAFAQDAREAAQLANMVDQWAASAEAQNTATTASNRMAADQLEFAGLSEQAGFAYNMTWSVPQMNMSDTMLAFQMANQGGGGGSGGSFSFGIPGVASYSK